MAQALLKQGRSFYGRLYPIIGRALLSKTDASKEASVISESALIDDDLAATPHQRQKSMNASSTSPSNGSFVLRNATAVATAVAAPLRSPFWAQRRRQVAPTSDPAIAQRQKLIENAARLFGAQKLRQAKQGDKTHELRARAQLQANVAQLAIGMDTLTASMRLVMAELEIKGRGSHEAKAKDLEA